MSAKAVLVLAVLFASVCFAFPASAFHSPPIAASAAADCPVRVVAIVARNSAQVNAPGGPVYAALLGSPAGPAKASGKFWVNASGKAFFVTFAHRDVVSPNFAGTLDPIAFRLPSTGATTAVDDAFVSDLPAPGGGPFVPCKIAGVWAAGTANSVPSSVLQRLASASSTAAVDAHAIDAGAGCRAPDVVATIATSVPAETPPIAVQQGLSGSVTVVVRVGADGSVAAARVAASPSELLTAAALAAARASIYRAAIVNCRPAASNVVFRADFR